MVRGLFPQAKIIVWRYEDFANVEDEVLARMSGLEPVSVAKPGSGDFLPSPSHEAIMQQLESAPALSIKDRIVHMRALRIKYPRTANSKRFTLWSEEEAARLSHAYASDVDAIKGGGDVEFLG
jgi:hypothetical protein